MKRQGRKSAAQTPAPKGERIYGSAKNPKGSAASKSSASQIKLSNQALEALKAKREKFKKEYPSKDVSLNTLKAVMRRGMGAYSKSHRPTITGGAPNSRQAWGYARVNRFLEKKAGKPVKKAYVQDDDLLEKGGQLPTQIAKDVYLSRDKNSLPKDAKIIAHRYNDKIKAGKEGLFAAEEDEIDVGYGKNIAYISIGKNAKVKKIKSTFDYLDEIGELEKPNQYLKEKYGYDTYLELDSEKGSLDNPNFAYYEIQKKALEEMRERGEDFEVLEMKYEDDLMPQQWLITTLNNPDIKYEKGGILDYFIHWTDKEGLENILSENVLYEETSLTNSFALPFDIENNMPFGIRLKNSIKSKLHKVGDIVGVTELEKEYEYRTKEEINVSDYLYGFVVRNNTNKNRLEKFLDNSSGFWNNNELSIDYFKKNNGYNILVSNSKYEKGGLIAPNGKPSNLTPEQYKLVRTPEFKAWFGDWENDPENASKVVDENGEPMVVYHGTKKIFTKFYETKYLKSQCDSLNWFSSNYQTSLEGYDGWITYPSFLKIIYPLQNLKGTPECSIYDERMSGLNTDGFIFSNGALQRPHPTNETWFGVSKSNQIKLAAEPIIKKTIKNKKFLSKVEKTFNALGNTTFDPNNPDIRFKEGGMNKIQLPDTQASYPRLKEVLKNQGYELNQIMKPAKSVEEIAEEFDVPLNFVRKQLEIGTEHEMEHTNSTELAELTALHHLGEDPEYYIYLKEMEMKREAKKLQDFYRSGGALEGETTCEVLDNEGNRMIDKEAIENLTECIEDLPQTKSMHFDYETNDYKPYRKKLHRDIIYKFKKDLVCVEQDEPIAILMGGSPASGKSTFLKKYAPYLLKEEILKIDADEIRAQLPEYRGYNASQTHLETKDIVNTLLSDRNIGIPCKFDVIYDGTMNNTKSYLPLINLLKSLGYKVFIVYIDKVPKDVVIKRSLERYKKQGRFVPLEVIEDFFTKGKSALEQLKQEVDGYMVVDGSDTEYRVMETGGERIPQDRNYSVIGSPVKITSAEVVREFKRGGQLDPDDPKIKNTITHQSGAAGGLLVGRRHSEGGIKAYNKSTGQPLEMEGGEVVITRDAVSDGTKREFEGEMLTNREILSRINQSGGGVAFADGGDIPEKCACSGKSYNYGGKLMKDNEIVENINANYRKSIGVMYPDLKPAEAMKRLFGDKLKYADGGQIFGKGGVLQLIDKQVPTFTAFAEINQNVLPQAMKKAYKDYLLSNYNIVFTELPHMIQSALLIGNQQLIDNYLNS